MERRRDEERRGFTRREVMRWERRDEKRKVMKRAEG